MTYTVAVRALCEFTAKCGDLDLRFTPSPTGQEGIVGHGIVTARRPDGYRREIALRGAWRELTVRGRADGYDPATHTLEEIKTYRGALDRIPDNHRQLHRAQAQVYGWLLCQQENLPGLHISVVYFDVDAHEETAFTEYVDAVRLQAFFEAQCEIFHAWAQREIAHRAARDDALRALQFPFGEFRAGQRELAEAVYKAASLQRMLLAQAPTGIGKTLGTLFPALKAMPGRLDNVLFLTAKTTGRALALEALHRLRAAGAQPLRVLELTAREKSCEHPDKSCHGESCPLAQGFYDRLPAARAAAAQRGPLDRAGLREIAAAHAVCPYYLGQEMARWSDVVVGDYNYFFDASALLFGLQQANEWRSLLLIDEAHSLVERARAMYSAELDEGDLATLRKTAPAALKKPLERLQRRWRAFAAEQAADYTAHDDVPIALDHALQQVVTAIGKYVVEHPAGNSPAEQPALWDFYFQAAYFGRLAESFDAHSLFDCRRYERGRPQRSVLCLRNVVPAPFLRERFAAAQAGVLFSATLSPWSFYRQMLGLPEQTAWLDVASPFRADQLRIHVADVSTRFRHRAASIDPIVAMIASQYRQRPGNYLAFFNSFDYLQQVAAQFAARHGDIGIWLQQRQMDEPARDAFIARFVAGGRGIGFAVLGGAFGEGIDLPGDRLIGAFVATLGLPQVNPVNEQILRRTEQLFGAAFAYDYTYLIPGIRKVAQAGGRIIRTVHDSGTLLLIDDRFLQRHVQRLLPGWWHIDEAAQPAAVDALAAP